MLPIRALEYDLARSQRADLEHLKRVVRVLGETGFNMMTINLEHRFEFPSCPGIGPPGSLTAEMARALVAHGRKQGVEVVPQPNFIGHCEGLGSTERYARLSCDPYQQAPWGGHEQLNLELPEARDLVRRMLADVCASFPGKHIHIGGDEVRRMDCIFPNRSELRLPKMMEYFHFVLEEARRTGRQVMMWGDMPLHHEELMKALPRDVIICDWHYGPEGSRETLERYKAQGLRVLAAPSVNTYARFVVDGEGSWRNISKMVGDAVELGLEGFLLTTWGFGCGSGFHLVWPWVALAAEIARGGPAGDWEAFCADFAYRRYGVDGRSFVRLLALLDRELAQAIQVDGVPVPRALVTLREALFRAADPFPTLARPAGFPPNHHQQVWEPSAFWPWLYLRPILDERMLARLEAISSEASDVASEIRSRTAHHGVELVPLVSLADALAVLVKRLRLLESARRAYHAAAQAQGEDAAAFAAHLKEAADFLEHVRAGIQTLKRIVTVLDTTMGFDAGEGHWLVVHEKSLDEHIAVLRGTEPQGDALLEFGEFLRRPAGITQRLTWR